MSAYDPKKDEKENEGGWAGLAILGIILLPFEAVVLLWQKIRRFVARGPQL